MDFESRNPDLFYENIPVKAKEIDEKTQWEQSDLCSKLVNKK
jgi:hypothetical protein